MISILEKVFYFYLFPELRVAGSDMDVRSSVTLRLANELCMSNVVRYFSQFSKRTVCVKTYTHVKNKPTSLKTLLAAFDDSCAL